MSGVEGFVVPVLERYTLHRRPLPWRGTRDPYKIWVSEVILQQTRAQQAIPYYERFLKRFPSLEQLASSSEEEVLSCWQGLGYYTRARNMRLAAQQLLGEYGGFFPKTPELLRRIKGIGPYTAAAIASFAFGYPEPVLDGNVFRLVARYFGIEADIRHASTRDVFMARLRVLIKGQDPALFNQAIMEFGAAQCRPRPLCGSCSLSSTCYAFLEGKTSDLPYKSALRPPRLRYFHYFVFESSEGMLFRLRSEQDIWRGLYDFYLRECEERCDWSMISKEEALCSAYRPTRQAHWRSHRLTHQLIYATFFHIQVPEVEVAQVARTYGLCFVRYGSVRQLPKPVLISNYLRTEKTLLF